MEYKEVNKKLLYVSVLIILFAFVFLVCFLILSVEFVRKNKAKGKAEEDKSLYKVVSVIDGDTIKILYKGNLETLRLIGIDSPETKNPNTGIECYGVEASAALANLLKNKYVYIETDSTQNERDKYGRLLAYVWVDDVFVNKWMLYNGYAIEYTYKDPYKYQSEFRSAEQHAKNNGLGLWKSCFELNFRGSYIFLYS